LVPEGREVSRSTLVRQRQSGKVALRHPRHINFCKPPAPACSIDTSLRRRHSWLLILSLLPSLWAPPAVPKFIGILLTANGSRLQPEKHLKIAILPTRAM